MTDLLVGFAEEARSAVSWLARLLLPGWLIATGQQDTHGSSRWARASETRRLGQVASPRRPIGDGIVLGWHRGRLLQSPAEDNVLLLGVQRSGKTSAVVVPTLLAWSGAVVATSTKEELVRLTGATRSRRGPVYVFSPLDRETEWVRRLGFEPATWNPVADAPDSGSAAELADHFTAEGKNGGSAHWYLSAANLLTGIFAVTHERGGDMGFALRALSRLETSDYRALAGAVADETTRDLLIAFANTPDREAGSIASTARSCLSLWIDDRVSRATSVPADGVSVALDLDAVLQQAGTLFLVAPAEEAERCRPLFSALLSTVLRRATERARALGGVLSPRLLLALDEAANFARIPRLSGYASSGPGQGIQLLLCYHDLAQLEAAYGKEQARTVWNNCRARLLLPGQGDLLTLEHFSRAIGDETRLYSTAASEGGRRSGSEQRHGRPLVSVDELRRMEQAVLLYANSPPARLRLRRWDQVSPWRAQVLSPTP